MITLKRVTADLVIPLRHKVLRPGQPIEKCFFEGDNDANSFHLAAFLNNEIVGVASFRADNSKFSSKPEIVQLLQNQNKELTKSLELSDSQPLPYRLRGMAVDPTYQSKGIGKEILTEGERICAEEKKTNILWFNARKNAFNFYQKLGYVFNSEEFSIDGVGIHRVMAKFLST